MPHRWKSVSDLLVVFESMFFFHPLASHFLPISAFSKAFPTVAARDPRGSPLMRKGVSMTLRNAMDCRGTDVVGPSMRARPWSIISTMVANFPLEGDDGSLMSTTRPTSTKRWKVGRVCSLCCKHGAVIFQDKCGWNDDDVERAPSQLIVRMARGGCTITGLGCVRTAFSDSDLRPTS